MQDMVNRSLTHLIFGTFAAILLAATFVSASPAPFFNSQLEVRAAARQAATNPICYNPPRDTCAFYATCVEPHYHCGPNGYPIGYGQQFCQKFSDQRNKLDAKGVTWMLNVMQCLQRVLIPEATGATGATKTCAALKTKAMGSHPKCYIDNGFCTLGPKDWAAIVDIIGIQTLLQDKANFLMALKAGVGCLEVYAYFLKRLA